MEKVFVSAQIFMEDSYELARKVFDSGFEPELVVAVWRGGCFTGSIVHETLRYLGIEPDHTVVRISSRDDDNSIRKNIQVCMTQYLLDNIKDRILIVDDVFDSGLSLLRLTQMIREHKASAKIRIATVYYKPKMNKTDIAPDFYVHETDRWIVFPHELIRLTKDEIVKAKGTRVAGLVG